MDHLSGTLLFTGALLLSCSVATAVWSLTQIVLELSDWRRAHGTRPRSAVARGALAGHGRRAVAAGAVGAVVLVWPVLAEATWALSAAL
ncbi:hypothetical protein GCM10011374_01440 [Kocuria dechangensis]|uniref:Uncharacterized protein n=1 Tax=Kocuria dechangensis TaxID=1176249 RepID=A0A917LLY5_9MICC|nr:hypothetical protein [Kocuria dechangensis]GGG42751.1 hypothetical protein GCM10011374_01440 [Kocuria dechangensis]